MHMEDSQSDKHAHGKLQQHVTTMEYLLWNMLDTEQFNATIQTEQLTEIIQLDNLLEQSNGITCWNNLTEQSTETINIKRYGRLTSLNADTAEQFI